MAGSMGRGVAYELFTKEQPWAGILKINSAILEISSSSFKSLATLFIEAKKLLGGCRSWTLSQLAKGDESFLYRRC